MYFDFFLQLLTEIFLIPRRMVRTSGQPHVPVTLTTDPPLGICAGPRAGVVRTVITTLTELTVSPQTLA